LIWADSLKKTEGFVRFVLMIRARKDPDKEASHGERREEKGKMLLKESESESSFRCPSFCLLCALRGLCDTS
jgi:hypothetical protein